MATKFPVMILYAVALHTVWGICLLVDPTADQSTAISGLYHWFGDFTWLLCLVVAISAFIGLTVEHRLGGLALMLPQQCFLMISAVSAYHAMHVGHFADGVERSRPFIVSDQMPAILAAIGHTTSVLRYVLKE